MYNYCIILNVVELFLFEMCVIYALKEILGICFYRQLYDHFLVRAFELRVYPMTQESYL